MKAIMISGRTFSSDFVITHNQRGFDEITFNVYPSEDVFPYLIPENQIQYYNQVYAIKSANFNGVYMIVEGQLEMSPFRETVFDLGTSKDKPASLTLTELFDKCPWDFEIVGENNTKVDWFEQKVTFKDVLKKAGDLYDAHFYFDYTLKKVTATFIESMPYKNNYVTDQLNIVSLSQQQDSYDLVTRLYFYGKNGDTLISIADVNDGKEYVEDFTYTDKILAKTAYGEGTDKNSLKEQALKELYANSNPVSSYTFQISHLDDYALPSLAINELVKYLDRINKKEIMHRIVEYKECPNQPANDSITLSSTAITIEKEVSKLGG